MKFGLVVFGGYGRFSSKVIESYYFQPELNEFEELIKAVKFEGGRVYENPVAEGLVAALEVKTLLLLKYNDTINSVYTHIY